MRRFDLEGFFHRFLPIDIGASGEVDLGDVARFKRMWRWSDIVQRSRRLGSGRRVVLVVDLSWSRVRSLGGGMSLGFSLSLSFGFGLSLTLEEFSILLSFGFGLS